MDYDIELLLRKWGVPENSIFDLQARISGLIAAEKNRYNQPPKQDDFFGKKEETKNPYSGRWF